MGRIVDVQEVQEELNRAARDAEVGSADVRAGQFVHRDGASETSAAEVTKDWFWEGNVVDSLAHYLTNRGWSIVNKADTHAKERGVDIHARKGETNLLVEVKGYPSKIYRDPRRAGQRKPTNPINQSQQWYSHALLKALRLQAKYPGAKVALGFPDFPRYRALFNETKAGFERLNLALLTVKANGEVEAWGLD